MGQLETRVAGHLFQHAWGSDFFPTQLCVSFFSSDDDGVIVFHVISLINHSYKMVFNKFNFGSAKFHIWEVFLLTCWGLHFLAHSGWGGGEEGHDFFLLINFFSRLPPTE